MVWDPALEIAFHPTVVAMVGVSADAKRSEHRPSGGATFIAGFEQLGFQGRIYPVNTKATEILGYKAYPSVSAIPEPVDLVVISVPAQAVPAVLEDCITANAKNIHMYTAGFEETGEEEAKELGLKVRQIALRGGLRIIGPNCVGLLAPKSHLTTLARLPLEPGPIAFFSQGGGQAEDCVDFGSPRGLGFSKVVSYGNALDVDESEFLEYLAQDPETEIISAYIEGVRDGRRFFSALKGATSQKPVVIYKGGTTEAGQRAARSHTASLTSSVAVFNAVCHQLNAIQVNGLEELIDVLVTLRFATPLPRGTGVAIVGAGGSPAVLASDAMESAGLQLPNLSPEVQTKLKQCLPVEGGGFTNPVDATNLVSPEAIYAALCVVGKVSDIHTLIYHLGFHPLSHWGNGRLSSTTYLQAAIDAFTQAQQAADKPVMLVLRPPPDLVGMKEFLATQKAFVKARFPVFHSLYNAAKAIARVVAWGQA